MRGAKVALFFELGILLHTFLRAKANNLGRPTTSPAPVESFLFHGDPSLWLQRWTPHGVGIEWIAWLLHFSWFIVPPLLLWAVYRRSGPSAAVRLIALMLALLLSADVAFALFPTRPPWMDIAVKRLVVMGYSSKASLDENAVAAMPSLHVAVPMLCTLWLAREASSLRRLTPWIALWTLGIAWASVYSGEHYLVDAIVGAAWAVATYAAFSFVLAVYAKVAPRRDTTPRALSPGHLPPSIGTVIEAEK